MPSDPQGTPPELATPLVQIREFQAGNRQAVSDLLERYMPIVCEIAAVRLGRRLREMLEVKDIVQETLKDAFASLHSFRHESEGSFRNWLARIVENNIKDANKKRGAKKRSARQPIGFVEGASSGCGMLDVPASGPSPSQVAMGAEQGELVERALLGLPERYREVLLLRYKCAMSFEEIAVHFRLTNANTARQMHDRAKKALLEAFQALGQKAP